MSNLKPVTYTPEQIAAEARNQAYYAMVNAAADVHRAMAKLEKAKDKARRLNVDNILIARACQNTPTRKS